MLDHSNVQKYQDRIAYVSQHSFLKSGYLLDNFRTDNEALSEKRIMECLVRSCFSDSLESAEIDLSRYLSDDASNLSGGEKQRLSIAKALYKQADLIFLDEATSAQDSKTEEKILKNLHSLSNTSLFFITHRTAPLEICDRVVDMEYYLMKGT
jgi:ATP-binding cassette, subfamily B, bacterial PglK